jgi:hypothetical protein
MYKILDTLFNFSNKEKIQFEKAIVWGILGFLFALLICKSIIG